MRKVTLKRIEERKTKKAALNNSRTRAAKAEAQRQYTYAHREGRKSIKTDKRVCGWLSQPSRRRNLKDLYNITKKLSGKFEQTDRPVKDKVIPSPPQMTKERDGQSISLNY